MLIKMPIALEDWVDMFFNKKMKMGLNEKLQTINNNNTKKINK